MNNITLKDLLNRLKEYNPEEVDIVKKAYYYASNLHSGQTRQSGEPYISHPLNVAYILAEMHADRDTICAGLLHDTLEDTNITKEDISHDFNQSIANLVDGVTKLSKMNFSSKQDQNYANTRNGNRYIIDKLTEMGYENLFGININISREEFVKRLIGSGVENERVKILVR